MYQSPENDENQIHNRFLSYITRVDKESPGIFKTPLGKIKMYDDITNMISSGIISRQEAEIWLQWAQEIFFKMNVAEQKSSKTHEYSSKGNYPDDLIEVKQSSFPLFNCVLNNVSTCEEEILIQKMKLIERELEYYNEDKSVCNHLDTIKRRIYEEIKRRFRA